MSNNDEKNLELEDSNANGHDKNDEIELLEDTLDKIDNVEINTEDREVVEKKKYDDLYDRFVRLAADFDNFKKRNAKEKSEIHSFGNEELIKALLNVIDNLERAISHAENDKVTEKSSSFKAFVDGVKLVHNQFISCLEKFDVRLVESEPGTEFDPRIHQAIDKLESDIYEAGLIISEMIKGYFLKERLLRPSMVSVSTGKKEEKIYKIDEDISEESILELDVSDDGGETNS